MVKQEKSVKEIGLVLFLVAAAAFLRLLPHVPNFVPIAATALFGGAYLSRRFAIAVPLSAMALSDYLILYINPFGPGGLPSFDFSHIYPLSAMFHTTTVYVWGSFLTSVFIGMWLKNHKKVGYIVGASFLASLQFFLITNFGVWAGGMYSRDISGLVESYIMGLPFFRWTILGDIFYTTAFFGLYEIAMWLSKRKTLDFYHLTHVR